MSAASHPPMPTPTAAGEFRRHGTALVAVTTGIALGVGVLPTYVTGLVLPELEADFGWGRTALSALPLIGSLIIVVTAPVTGIIVDRFGVRMPAVISLLALGAGYFALSRSTPSFSRYVLLFALMYVLAAASTAVAFTRTVNERYDRARGLALGIALSGAGLVGFAVPSLLGPVFVENWRVGYRFLAAVVLAGAIVVFALMPRGGSTAAPGAVRNGQAPVLRLIRRRLFWQLSFAYLSLALAAGGMLQHLFSMLRDQGVSAASASGTVSLVGIAVIVSRLVVGALIDRFFAPRVAAIVLLFSAAGYVALLIGGAALAALAAIGIGLASGAEVDIIGNLTSRYYDLESYSRVFGIFYAVFFLGFGASPLLIAYLRDLAGGYAVPVALSAALMAVATILLFTAPPFPARTASHDARLVPLSKPVA